MEKQHSPTYFLQKMEINNLLQDKGYALDLGFGEGNDSVFLAQLGFTVEAIELYSFKVHQLEQKKGDLPITVIKSDLGNFEIKKNKYSLIVSNNVLPFISDKQKVLEIILNCATGLISGGKMYLTLFGPEDDWSNKLNMSFFEFEEALAILENLDLKLYHCSTEEGYGPTTTGDMKFWHIHKFLYIKP